jgi:hypothetical protein
MKNRLVGTEVCCLTRYWHAFCRAQQSTALSLPADGLTAQPLRAAAHNLESQTSSDDFCEHLFTKMHLKNIFN